ncbi:serine hydrolase domain-containing protein [Paraburkholderia sp. ZP32-5]|uniref:serine hydrolase domain-containing protein n=1 Tax=Paraburkholderia sp. ZP32-5 TaxID=2883245 RepID=UPI001F1AC190|nr:serine hydrolase [Paraburkholderia sp. ZP32-5]
MSDRAVDPATTSTAVLATAPHRDGLTRAAPSTTGADADAIGAFLDDVDAAGLDLHSLMLYHRGHVVAEAWRWPYRADRPRILHSVAKSFTACAIGLALADGLFRLDDKVVDFFPEARPAPDASAGNGQDWLAQMTIEDLLTMRTGHEGETSGAAWRSLQSSWIAEFFRIPLVHQPGSAFMYTSAASYVLSAILSRVTGETLHDYLKPRIFEPLGIHGEKWDIGPDGINPGGNGLTATMADMLKLGLLHAQNGVWEGRRLLPEQWVKQATQPHGEPFKYGYHWWTRGDGNFSAIGRFVQMVTVFPAHGAALAVTGAIKGSGRLFPHIDRYFPVAFRDPKADSTAAREAAAADARLTARLAAWQSPDAPAPWKLADRAVRAPMNSGARRFTIASNPHGVQTLEFGFADDRCTFRLIDAHGPHTIVAGFDRWIETRTDMPGSDLHHGYHLVHSPVVARACWVDERRLQMTWIFAETAFRDTVIAEFDGTRLVFRREVNINGGALRHEDLNGTLSD